MNYGDTALGVEYALPAGVRLSPARNPGRRFADWLIALLAGRS